MSIKNVDSAKNWCTQTDMPDLLRYYTYLNPVNNPMPLNHAFLERVMFGIRTEAPMNKIIAEVFEKTVDAVLVDKYFHTEIPETFTGKLLCLAYGEKYLAEAKRREEVANLKK